MKILVNFIKTGKENLRDWKIILLVIVFAPFFVFMMRAYLGGSEGTTLKIALLNRDSDGEFAGGLQDAWQDLKDENGHSLLTLLPVTGREQAEALLKQDEAGLAVIIPEQFSQTLERHMQDATSPLPVLTSLGNPGQTTYMTAASLIDYGALAYIGRVTGTRIPLEIHYESVGIGQNSGEFNLYVPALLVLGLIMILFTTGASLIREVERGTIIRLALSRLKVRDFLIALSLNQLVIGLLALACTLLAAWMAGYSTEGSLLLVLAIGLPTSFAVIGIGIITACFLKNMFGLLTIGCFPFFILMFFSDCVLPLPKIPFFTLLGNQIYLNDILPTATATRALNKVLSFNAGAGEIAFELAWICGLGLCYFLCGMILFRRKYPAGIRKGA